MFGGVKLVVGHSCTFFNRPTFMNDISLSDVLAVGKLIRCDRVVDWSDVK